MKNTLIRFTALVLALLTAMIFVAADEGAFASDTNGIAFLIGAAEETGERTFPTDDEWEPPDLSDVGDDHPELQVLAVAQGELGYVEGPNEYSKYGEFFGTPSCQWCAEFITWCVNEADTRNGTSLLRNLYPYYANPDEGAPWFIERNRFVSSNGKIPSNGAKQWWPDKKTYLKNNEYIPYPGDYLWLYVAEWGDTTTHVALVEGVSIAPDGDYTIHVIEGNMPDRVQRATYMISNVQIYGFGTPVERMMTNMRLYYKMDDVIRAKTWLKDLGYYTDDDMTNVFTKELKSAVAKFQKKHKISAKGVLDMETWCALQEEAESSD